MNFWKLFDLNFWKLFSLNFWKFNLNFWKFNLNFWKFNLNFSKNSNPISGFQPIKFANFRPPKNLKMNKKKIEIESSYIPSILFRHCDTPVHPKIFFSPPVRPPVRPRILLLYRKFDYFQKKKERTHR